MAMTRRRSLLTLQWLAACVAARDEAPLYRRGARGRSGRDRKSTRLNSSHLVISYAVFCLKKKISVVHPVSGVRLQPFDHLRQAVGGDGDQESQHSSALVVHLLSDLVHLLHFGPGRLGLED